MSPGKMAAQAGHAFTSTLLKSRYEIPEISNRYESLSNIGTKIVLKAKSLDQIYRIKFEAERLGLTHELIIDSGHILPPHFDGNPVVTALGVGPVAKNQVPFLRRLSLVK